MNWMKSYDVENGTHARKPLSAPLSASMEEPDHAQHAPEKRKLATRATCFASERRTDAVMIETFAAV